MGVKAERALATRTALLAAARDLFAADGFAATSTETILAATGVTRGALYHHFADKQALFAAVCESLHAEAEQVIEVNADAAPNAFDALVAGCLSFLDFMIRPEIRRILILDAPDKGRRCERNGDFEFRATGKRKYWRLQQMEACGGLTDYVDVYY